ncbi:hypothetical protein OIU78_003539 [Salix suchowensis]|nr:hypothetical protein OIU78_003539 [Salix suchowensis]KAJ6363385.1 hypothetical protein OIU78_003539 [Salix suchowensis]KAJ6363386.1 hypothetical protein OIU78_003539 [Salix suchowensis]
MDDPSSSATTLAWLWVIEYLASFPEIEASILHDLIEAAPKIADHLGNNTKEMVALRCLEGLFCRNNGITNDIPSKEPKVTFDLSERCEDVLQSILQEKPVSDLKRAGQERLKWDIHPFITHKRASMPKCALEKVKDAILEGIHPYASLKEYSGLVDANDRCNIIPVNYGDLGAPAGRIDGSDSDGQINAPEENFIPLRGIEVEGDSCNSHSLHFKRARSGLASKNLAGDLGDQNCVDDGDHLHPQAKRFKQDAVCDNQSLEHISTPPQQHMDRVEDSFERVIGDSENKDCHMGKKTSQGGSEENRPVENGHDECVGMDRQGQCLDPDNAFQHNQHEIAHNANKMPQDISGDRLHPYSLVDGINCAEARISNTAPSVGTPKKIFVNENEDNSDHSGQLKPSNSLCHPDAAVRTNLISNGEKVGEEVVRDNSSGTGLDRNQHEVCADPNDSDADQLCKEKDVFSESQRKDGQRQKAVCFTNNDEGETSDDENDKSSTSNYFIRFRNIEKQHRYPIMPQLRRKKVSWTVQEEEMLKEGVQKFSSDGKFPWKDILEYGSSVFLNGRTTIDLKDKWRNMCKVSPKSK